MSELTDFLLARIAEDEEIVSIALQAIDADRTPYAAQLARRTAQLSTVTASSHCGQDTGPRGTVEARPGRVQADVDGKRLIVRNASRHQPGQRGYGAATYVARCIALAYADHADYRQEWAP